MIEVAAAFIKKTCPDGKCRFLICQRHAEKARGMLWEFVGGKLEPGEDARDALIRECREELGITVSPAGIFADIIHEYPDITVHLTVLEAEISEGIPRLLEHNAMEWITPEQIDNYDFCPADCSVLDKIKRIYLDNERKSVMGILSCCKPAKVFEFFELISSVPHGSGNTKQISDICVKFAEKRGLEWYQDDLNNVIIRKPAAPGYENAPTVILQGHLDMVCAKNADDPRDMAKEPVTLCTDGEWVWADGTSLGGDDGIAVACAMAVLDDDELEHPAIEAVFTVDEESGMDGAAGIDPAQIKGRMMLNIDSEEEGVFTVSCAGGLRVNCEIPAHRSAVPAGYIGAFVTVSGLLGGHSGCEIHKERGSSHQLMGRLLYEASKAAEVRLVSLWGGEFDNVIPSKTSAEIVIPENQYEAFTQVCEKFNGIYKKELVSSDPGVDIAVSRMPAAAAAVDKNDTSAILRALVMLPYGLQNMSMDISGLPQTSLNMGIIRLEENVLKFCFFIRSSIDSQKEYVAEKVVNIIEAVGGSCDVGNGYPGWAFCKDSYLLDVAKSVYKDLNGKDPVISATHGGLECGLLIDKLPGLECISIGPALYDIHSVREKLNVTSTERLYELICEILRRMK